MSLLSKILPRAPNWSEPALIRTLRTFTLEALPHQPPQHLPAVVAEGRRAVRVDEQSVGPDLEVLHRRRA